MRRLLLVRHARAMDAAGLADRDRPLVERGEQSAAALGTWLYSSGTFPDWVLCSPARRARETWEHVGRQLGTVPDVSYEERIYQADESALLTLVRETGEDVRTLLLIGHNPAIHRLASTLTDAAALNGPFPAASAVVMDVSGSWTDLDPGSAELLIFRKPD